MREVHEILTPLPIVVVDDVIPAEAAAAMLAELTGFQRHFVPALFGAQQPELGNQYTAQKKNDFLVLKDDYPDDRPSATLEAFRRGLWDEELLTTIEACRSPMAPLLRLGYARELQVQSSGDGDYHGWHRDPVLDLNVSILLFLSTTPPRFGGGVLEFQVGSEIVPIEFRHNRALIFPAKSSHRVTPVSLDDRDFAARRFSIVCWPRRRSPGSAGETVAMAHKGTTRVPRKMVPAVAPPKGWEQEVGRALDVVFGKSAWSETTRTDLLMLDIVRGAWEGGLSFAGRKMFGARTHVVTSTLGGRSGRPGEAQALITALDVQIDVGQDLSVSLIAERGTDPSTVRQALCCTLRGAHSFEARHDLARSPSYDELCALLLRALHEIAHSPAVPAATSAALIAAAAALAAEG